MSTILGIETSCDETALALIETRENAGTTEYRIISSLIHSQAELHSAYGGVFPTLAKREHSKNLVPLLEKILLDLPTTTRTHDDIQKALDAFQKTYGEQNADLMTSLKHAHFLKHIPHIDRIAVTQGPGLEPALWVGITFARILGELWNIPVVPVDHMEGHVVGSLLDHNAPYGTWGTLKPLPDPSVALLVSGGHTELIKIKEQRVKSKDNAFTYTLLGKTRDDAVGEAFDKTARLLGLPYPGGPHISLYASKAYEQNITSTIKLPRPMISTPDVDFSFSGLKTAVLYAVKEEQLKGVLTEEFKMGLAREFQESITDVLIAKTRRAIEETGAQSLIVGGGVSANTHLRSALVELAQTYSIPLYLPTAHIAGDNALMIALVGAHASPSTDIRASGTKSLTE